MGFLSFSLPHPFYLEVVSEIDRAYLCIISSHYPIVRYILYTFYSYVMAAFIYSFVHSLTLSLTPSL